MSPSLSVCHVFLHIVTTVAVGHIVSTMTLDTIVAFDTSVVFDIPLFVLFMSSLMVLCKEHLWNFSVCQRIQLSNLVNKLSMAAHKLITVSAALGLEMLRACIIVERLKFRGLFINGNLPHAYI
jgi:hypothetical protein